MEINYTVVSVIGIAFIVLISWLIWRNKKDQKAVERGLNLSEMEPEKHKDESGSV